MIHKIYETMATNTEIKRIKVSGDLEESSTIIDTDRIRIIEYVYVHEIPVSGELVKDDVFNKMSGAISYDE